MHSSRQVANLLKRICMYWTLAIQTHVVQGSARAVCLGKTAQWGIHVVTLGLAHGRTQSWSPRAPRTRQDTWCTVGTQEGRLNRGPGRTLGHGPGNHGPRSGCRMLAANQLRNVSVPAVLRAPLSSWGRPGTPGLRSPADKLGPFGGSRQARRGEPRPHGGAGGCV